MAKDMPVCSRLGFDSQHCMSSDHSMMWPPKIGESGKIVRPKKWETANKCSPAVNVSIKYSGFAQRNQGRLHVGDRLGAETRKSKRYSF